MELVSSLMGVDSLRKLLVFMGLSLIAIGFLYPIQRNLELKNKQIALSEAKRLDSIELINIRKDIETCEAISKKNTIKVNRYIKQRDSLLQGKLDENSKFKINFLQTEIAALNSSDVISIKDYKEKLNRIETTKVKVQSLEKEICNLEDFINCYQKFGYAFMIGGVILLCKGLYNWKRSQKDSDELVTMEVQIKKEELKKLQRENNP